jgi:tetratricopeptide (TPR) repeat protein
MQIFRKLMSPRLIRSKMPVRAPFSRDQGKSRGQGEQGDHRFDHMIRVFISSTFRDMRRERDVMMAHVFPQARRWCEQRGVTWREIDLRWGITVEEAHRGEALRLCLEEVEACFPFFIALLGERYGHVQKDITMDLLTRFPWLKDFQGRSITEMEIEAGALSQPAPSPTVLFYFRDPEFLQRLPAGEDLSDYRSETDEAQTRLTELKRRIAASGHRTRRFASPQELAEVMSTDLLDMLAIRFPASRSEQVADAQWNFARTRGRFFVGPGSWLRAIDRHVATSGLPLLVTGEIGSGKSAVLAAWALNQIGGDQNVVMDPEPWWRRIPAEWLQRDPTTVRIVPWFVGAIEDREDWRGIARGLMSVMDPNELPGDPAKDPLSVRSRLSTILHRLRERTVLIIDGLDQIRDFDPGAPVTWIPENLPPKVRVIVSATDAAVVDWARRHHWEVLELPRWNVSRRLNFIVAWFETFGRKLDRATLNQIATSPQSAQPLFLCTLLEELRMFGSLEGLPQKVNASLGAKSARELYAQMLVRLESVGGASRVRDLFSFLQVSRRGITEPELAALLGSPTMPLPSAFLSPILLAAREALVNKRGRLRCERIELRDAIVSRYLTAGDAVWRERLVQHFSKEPWSMRKAEELPWQLAALARWNALAELLGDPDFLCVPGGLIELRWAWSWLIANAPEFRPEATYRGVITDPAAYPKIARVVGWLLKEMGRSFDALPIGQYLLTEARYLGEPEALAEALARHAALLSSTGQFSSALGLWFELREFARERGNLVYEARSLAGAGNDLRQLGRTAEALETWRAEERLCREIGDQAALSACIANLAILSYKRDPRGAIASLRAHMKTCRLTDDLDGLRRCLGNLGVLYNSESEPDEALIYLREEALICRRYRDDEELQICLGNQAESQKLLANYDAALNLLEEKARLCRELRNAAGQAHALLQQAHLFGEKLGAIGAACDASRRR